MIQVQLSQKNVSYREVNNAQLSYASKSQAGYSVTPNAIPRDAASAGKLMMRREPTARRYRVRVILMEESFVAFVSPK
jgi:hypothetical protein